MKAVGLSFALLFGPLGLILFGAPHLAVTVSNTLPLARSGQTIEISAADLAQLGEPNLQKLHVKDRTGNEILCQAVDTDLDEMRKPDILIFQTDLQPNETKAFTIVSGSKRLYKKADFKAFGRFVRERFDDFAWENDRIAHRMYGKALETWKGDPLTSSSVDIWSKRVPQLVIDEWYMLDNYHSDSGQGADFYSAGSSRGCGGTGLWADDKMWVSRNFVDSRVLANGPIRIMFELVYEPFQVGQNKVSEVKRITLDAGSNLDHFQSYFKLEGGGSMPECVVGLKKVQGEHETFDPTTGSLVAWEKVEKNQGMEGVAVLVAPKLFSKEAQDEQNHLLVVKPTSDNSLSYWAGFGWDKAGAFTDEASWRRYVEEFARGLQSPVTVTVTAGR